MRKTLALIILFGALGGGCGTAASADGPPEINYGRDICIECGMIIDDPRFAAAYRLEDGTERSFDDLGGLIVYGRESGEIASATVWVSDFEDEVMIEAASAFYVPTLGVASPMGHGILAFADKTRATAMADSLDGMVMTWESVMELPVMDGLVGHHHMDEKDDMSEMDDMDGHEHGDG